MTYPEAALKILEEAGRPLTYQQITAIAMERNWIEPQGTEPAGMMNTLIMQDLKTKGTRSEFSRISPGTYTLRKLIYKNVPDLDDKPASPNGNTAPGKSVSPRAGHHKGATGKGASAKDAQPKSDRRGHGAKRQPPPKNYDQQQPLRNYDSPALARNYDQQQPLRNYDPLPKNYDSPPKLYDPPPPQKPYEPPKKAYEAPRTAPATTVNRKELWEIMESVGTLMGYKIQPVLLSDRKTNCMGWHIAGNPELAFILWVPEGTDMPQGVHELIGLNYHKVIVMADEDQMPFTEVFVEGIAAKDKVDIVPLGYLLEKARRGIQYMEFYNHLCDCRPLKDRKSYVLTRYDAPPDRE